jgi:hypothetical protein
MDQVSGINLGNNGIRLAIHDSQDKHVGNLRIGKATVVWMRGKTTEKYGKRIPLEKLLKLMDDM